MIALHEDYGEIVRVGPRTVSISNKDMLKQILVTEDLVKAPIYDLFASKVYIHLFFFKKKRLHVDIKYIL
jgi:hypothetical protein